MLACTISPYESKLERMKGSNAVGLYCIWMPRPPVPEQRTRVTRVPIGDHASVAGWQAGRSRADYLCGFLLGGDESGFFPFACGMTPAIGSGFGLGCVLVNGKAGNESRAEERKHRASEESDGRHFP